MSIGLSSPMGSSSNFPYSNLNPYAAANPQQQQQQIAPSSSSSIGLSGSNSAAMYGASVTTPQFFSIPNPYASLNSSMSMNSPSMNPAK